MALLCWSLSFDSCSGFSVSNCICLLSVGGCVQSFVPFFELIKENGLILCEVEHAIASLVMLGNYLLYLFTLHLLSKLLHGIDDVISCYFARLVRVKGVENNLEA